MALTLTGTGGVFTRLGRVGKVAHDMRTYQGTTLPTDILSLMAQYDTLRTAVDGVPTADKESRAATSQIMSSLKTVAENTLLEMVKADKPSMSNSIADALTELRTQMIAAPATVKACTVAATATALSTNFGNGQCVVTTKRGDGLVQENMFAEVSPIVCTSDSQTGGATLGQETFTYTGEPYVTDVWSDLYPIGSGQSTTLTAIDASLDADGNLLTNSDFESFTANLPDNWTALVGVAGTNFQKSTVEFFDGLASLQYIGDGATLTSLVQSFDSAGGTTSELEPDTVYAVNCWMKTDDATSTGVVKIELVNASNAVITDDQAVDNAITKDIADLTTSWVAVNGVFRTPRAMPSAVKIRIRLTTALSSGDSIFIDRLAMAPAQALYNGGPLACVFSGQTTAQFIEGDGWNLTTTNNLGGASNLSTFQQLFDRLFGMRDLGIVLPSDASPSIADSLISS